MFHPQVFKIQHLHQPPPFDTFFEWKLENCPAVNSTMHKIEYKLLFCTYCIINKILKFITCTHFQEVPGERGSIVLIH